MLEQKIEQIAAKVAKDRCDCQIYDVEFKSTEMGRTLIVYLDRSQGPPVDLDSCSEVSRGLNLLLDVEDLIPGGTYHLEVSSPGLERHLRKPWHFERVIGQRIFIQTCEKMDKYGVKSIPMKASRKATIRLKNVDEQGIIFVDNEQNPDSELYHIPFDAIHKAHLIFEMENKSTNKKKTNRKK